MTDIRTKEERQLLAFNILRDLQTSGMDADAYPAIRQFKEILKQYANQDDAYAGFNGSLPFPEAGEQCKLVYQLPMRKTAKPNVVVSRPEPPAQQRQRPGMRRLKTPTKAQQALLQEKETLRQQKRLTPTETAIPQQPNTPLELPLPVTPSRPAIL